jgi:drug/metabolite transporter (DMT)-like permease
VIGHTLMNRAIGQIQAQVPNPAGLGSVPSTALIAWLLWRKTPSPLFWGTLMAFLASLALLLWPARQSAADAGSAVPAAADCRSRQGCA